LGALRDDDALKTRVAIASRDADDEWFRLAILTGLGDTCWPFLRELIKQHGDWLSRPTGSHVEFLAQVSKVIGARNRDAELAACIGLVAETKPPAAESGCLAILAGLPEGLSRTQRPFRAPRANPPACLKERVHALEPLFQSAHGLASAEREEPSRRVVAIQLLTRAKPESVKTILPSLLQAREPQAVQFAAARGLGELGD